jgi:hypothetical protein
MAFFKHAFFFCENEGTVCVEIFYFTWTPLCVHIWLTIFITQFWLVPDLLECNCCLSLECLYIVDHMCSQF